MLTQTKLLNLKCLNLISIKKHKLCIHTSNRIALNFEAYYSINERNASSNILVTNTLNSLVFFRQG